MLSEDGGADSAVAARVCKGWNKFRQLLTNKDVSLFMRGNLYFIQKLCVSSCMLHGSETWPVNKENELALQQMRMIRWMSTELRERLGIGDIITVLQ